MMFIHQYDLDLLLGKNSDFLCVDFILKYLMLYLLFRKYNEFNNNVLNKYQLNHFNFITYRSP